MRFQLVFILVLFALGALVGDRYGVPSIVTGLTDRAFETVEASLGISSDDQAAEEDGSDVDENDAVETASSVEPEPSAPEDVPASGNTNGNDGLRMNDAGLQIIKDSEALRLESYQAGGRWYVGYGHSRTAEAGMTITEAEADRLLREDVQTAEDGVRSSVTVPMNVNQFSAMVSLAYNLGTGGFKNTQVFARINDGDYAGAADAFLIHDRARIDGELQSVPHLTERREKERALFLTPA